MAEQFVIRQKKDSQHSQKKQKNLMWPGKMTLHRKLHIFFVD